MWVSSLSSELFWCGTRVVNSGVDELVTIRFGFDGDDFSNSKNVFVMGVSFGFN